MLLRSFTLRFSRAKWISLLSKGAELLEKLCAVLKNKAEERLPNTIPSVQFAMPNSRRRLPLSFALANMYFANRVSIKLTTTCVHSVAKDILPTTW